MRVKIITRLIYRSGCWGCLKAKEDPTEKYVCPKLEQHWKEYNEWEARNDL